MVHLPPLPPSPQFFSDCHYTLGRPFPLSQHHPLPSPPPPLNAISRYMSLYCSCLGNALTPVLPSLAKSATAHILKANILTNVQVAGPGCNKSAQDWQMSHFTTLYGSAPSLSPHNGKHPYEYNTIPSSISSPNGEKSHSSLLLCLPSPNGETTPTTTPPFYT